MPIFSQTYPGDLRLPGPRWLSRYGPLVKVSIQVPGAVASLAAQSGHPAPVGQEGLALVDTGAASSAVDDAVIRKIGVAPIGLTLAGTAGGGHLLNVYPATLGFEQLGLTLVFDRVVGCHIAPQGIIALLGRDVLSRMLLVYDGPAGHIALGH